ncbi:MAG TPA: hypothetical protein VF316_22070 [Polyangiaceae bacterium]
MSLALLRLLEHVHGHVGWLAVAALLHPAILLRNPRRRARLSVILATLLAMGAGAMGAAVYPEYRLRLKQEIFLHAPRLGWCFERKEHLAVGAIGFAVIGCIAHLSAWGFEDDGVRELMARSAHRAYVAAFGLAFVVAVLGVAVASFSTF